MQPGIHALTSPDSLWREQQRPQALSLSPYPATFILLLFKTPILPFCLLAPRNTWCDNACFGAQVSSKYGTWYSERVILQFMCVGWWAGVTYLRYTVLTSSKKGETALHCCDPTLSVLVMLVPRNVFHVVSVLQSIVCLHTSYRDLTLFDAWPCDICVQDSQTSTSLSCGLDCLATFLDSLVVFWTA